MTYLINGSQFRSENDNEAIVNLLRKGWVEIMPPSYNLVTQRIEWNSETGSFDILDIPREEVRQQNLSQAVSQGFLVQPENITLALADSDRILFAQMLSLVELALSLGMINNDTPQIIGDIQGNKHTVTTLRFRQIMVEYGFFYKSLWDEFG